MQVMKSMVLYLIILVKWFLFTIGLLLILDAFVPRSGTEGYGAPIAEASIGFCVWVAIWMWGRCRPKI